MTMAEKPRQMGKREELTPWRHATAVVTPMHSAECEDGIPPESNRGRQSHLRDVK